MNIGSWIFIGIVFGIVAGQIASRANLGVVGNVALAIGGVVLAAVLGDLWAGGIEISRSQLGSGFGSMTSGVIMLVMHDEQGRRISSVGRRTP